jgi:hypothetical protein
LTKPENRFSRNGTSFPNVNFSDPPAFAGTRLGDDILMTNVLAFDVQVYDPGAPVFVSGGVSLEPRDQGYSISPNPPAFGAYVDLGYAPTYTATGTNPAPLFNRINPNGTMCGLPTTGNVSRIYDTWSLHYENDGVLQKSTVGADAMTNGLDDGGAAGVVDDLGEADTLPPYSAPLRAIRITIRVYEPSSQQVRQVTVVQDFLPE